MKLTIEPKDFNPSEDLLKHVEEIFSDLDHYHDQIFSADISPESTNRHEEDDKSVKIKIFLPGRELFIEEFADNFVSAAQSTHKTAKQNIIKIKEKDKDNKNPRPDKPN